MCVCSCVCVCVFVILTNCLNLYLSFVHKCMPFDYNLLMGNVRLWVYLKTWNDSTRTILSRTLANVWRCLPDIQSVHQPLPRPFPLPLLLCLIISTSLCISSSPSISPSLSPVLSHPFMHMECPWQMLLFISTLYVCLKSKYITLNKP